MERDPDQCFLYPSYLDSRDQIKNKKLRGEVNSEIADYEAIGCHKCYGFDKECRSYISLNSIKGVKK